MEAKLQDARPLINVCDRYDQFFEPSSTLHQPAHTCIDIVKDETPLAVVMMRGQVQHG